MRVLLVGTPDERLRLRQSLDRTVDVAGEYATLSEARKSAVSADAILLAPSRDAGDWRDAPPETLTAREIEVLELMAEGLPNKAIAARLAISDQTVKFHVASIAGKLGASNRTDAVRRAIRGGLITI
jgi:DNA-binding NarL/FixJ family response regulator